ERDVMFLSLVTAHNHNRRALVSSSDERRFNVAASRAKEQVWLFHSVQLEDLSNRDDLRYKLLDHYINYKDVPRISDKTIDRKIGNQPEPYDSWFEVDVHNDIINRGYKVIPQYKVANGKYRIDLVALLSNGTKIAIECDGDKFHGAEQFKADIMRQKDLERCGWQFYRIRGCEYYSNRDRALENLWEILGNNEPKYCPEEKSDSNTNEKMIIDIADEIVIQKDDDNEIFEPTIDKKHTDNQNDLGKSDISNIIVFFNLFKSGIYIMSDQANPDAEYSIPIKQKDKNGFMMQCYESGNINKVYIDTLLRKKNGKEYMNGFNEGEKIILIKVIESECIVGIKYKFKFQTLFKAHKTDNITTREVLSLKGYKVIYNDYDKIEYYFLPLEFENSIRKLVYQSFIARGKNIENKYYEEEWEALKKNNVI
ncbi:MAG: DUF559 domain-containing protein, partial [Erysipelotrichales bacterium]|nr:DUF559 domain-containing protein [Erysipelotrichales bacterium]